MEEKRIAIQPAPGGFVLGPGLGRPAAG